jgi:hypothetical protein
MSEILVRDEVAVGPRRFEHVRNRGDFSSIAATPGLDFMAAHDAAAVGNTCCEKIVLSIFNARGYVAHKESREEIT